MRVRRLLSQWKVDIVCLQETKLDLISSELVQSIWELSLCGVELCGF
jgi:exonuclease III